MILKSFSVELFRQYMKRQEIRFAIDNERKRNVTIINGVNGTGKTSLFAAINWCLFGFEAIRTVSSIDVEDEEDLFCKEAISRAVPGEQLQMSATLTFIHKGDQYEVSRCREAIKDTNGGILLKKERFLVAKRCFDGTTDILSTDDQDQFGPEREIRKVLPVEASKYFFFDGELIDSITRPGSKQIASAINNIFKVNNLVEIHKSIKSIIKSYEHRMAVIDQSNKELEKAIHEKEKLEGELHELDQKYEQISRSMEEAEEYKKRIEREIKDSGAERVNEQIKYQEGIINSKREEVEELAKIVKKETTDAYYVLALPILRKAYSSLADIGAQEAIPSYALQRLARDLLSQLCCICGRPFEEDGPEYQRLRALLEKNVFDDNRSNREAGLSTELFSLEQSSREKLEHLGNWCKRYVDLRDTITNELQRLDDLHGQLEAMGGASVAAWQKQWREVTERYYALQKELDRIGKLREMTNSQMKDKENKINAISNSKNVDLIKFKHEIARSLRDVVEDNIQKYKEKVRVDISRKASEIFRLLLWKEGQFQEISLDESFNLEVVDRYSKPALQDLSSGERQILSLAFIVAMSRLSGEEAPLVMDTPFGRLSAENRANITEHLPELADQVILFVTDEELHDQARANLEPHIGREYNLDFDRRTGCTTIVEVRR